MANPQPRPFIRLSQELFEALYRADFTGSERRIIDFIIRMTWGFGRKKFDLFPKDFVRGKSGVPGTNMVRRTVFRAVENLWKRNVIIYEPKEGTTLATYSIQKDYDLWCESFPQPDGTPMSLCGKDHECPSSGTPMSQFTGPDGTPMSHTYKKDKKDNLKKEKSLPVENSEKQATLDLVETRFFQDENGKTISEITTEIKNNMPSGIFK